MVTCDASVTHFSGKSSYARTHRKVPGKKRHASVTCHEDEGPLETFALLPLRTSRPTDQQSVALLRMPVSSLTDARRGPKRCETRRELKEKSARPTTRGNSDRRE